MTRTMRRAIALVVGVFVLGVVTGAAALRIYIGHRIHALTEGPPPEVEPRAALWVIDRNVGLDADQRRAVLAVLLARRREVATQRRRIEPEVRPIYAQTYADVRALLRPDQVARFDALAARYEGKRRRAIGADDVPPSSTHEAP